MPNLAGLDDNSMSTDQEGVPVPYLIGEDILPAHWITRAYNLTPRESEREQPGKK